MTYSTFSGLGISEPLCRALAAENYTDPTPIQTQAIPRLLEGRDLLGIAQTGTGKTAAFALPILQKLGKPQQPVAPRSAHALILAPTRELAIQIGESFATYGRHTGLRHTVILGGVGQPQQVKAMARGVDILIATPGRLLDLVQQKHVRLDAVKHFVLDEADRMLDMGFIRDVRKLVTMLPKKRQSLLFSATMPSDVAKLASEMLHNPLRVEVAPEAVTVDLVDQRVHFVETAQKRALLTNLLEDPALARVIVFTRTKHHANRVSEHLERAGISNDALHGNKSQNARQRALQRFRAGDARVLVATDIASRGIDVDGVTHVINFELPHEPESYVHRIGRTARAGNTGIAVAFCDASERPLLRDIERLTR
ncbi:MAG TPA: DEAD/DEAH box helicase, partial [Rhizomicrobium sp.]|nr:DEAD/DEAH box helicase [Rhizomicrobium sp.]